MPKKAKSDNKRATKEVKNKQGKKITLYKGDTSKNRFAAKIAKSLGLDADEFNWMVKGKSGKLRPYSQVRSDTAKVRRETEEAKWWAAVHANGPIARALHERKDLPAPRQNFEFGPKSKMGLPYCGYGYNLTVTVPGSTIEKKKRNGEVETKKIKEFDSKGNPRSVMFNCKRAKNEKQWESSKAGPRRMDVNKKHHLRWTWREIKSTPFSIVERMAQRYNCVYQI